MKRDTDTTASIVCSPVFTGCSRVTLPVKRAVHSHEDSWQLELIRGGRAEVRTDNAVRPLEVGAAVLIPPGVPHMIRYLENGTEFLCFRFRANVAHQDARVSWLPSTPLMGQLLHTLSAVLPHGATLAPAEEPVVGFLLSGVMHMHALGEQGHSVLKTPAIVEKVKLAVEQNIARAPSLAALCRSAGYSKSHVFASFRAHEGTTLKRYYDERRTARIKQYLVYSELTMSEIAENMGFADVYAFSRLFKRMTGVSPSLYRKRHWRRQP
ncbi:MAG: helix-turn-helix domain-containing protein [Kiritimatiellae bacterium]|nr:helix-turn-helix domain-containing protein [Kiritimatiellia bacterium]